MRVLDGEARWALVVPVKPLATAKSRLRPGAGGVGHDRLALAFALDTVAAALASEPVAEVLVVTDDVVAGQALSELGAHAVPDEPHAGLNTAVRHGAALVAGRPVAALAADLPALRSAELAAALDDAAVRGRRCFVPDAPGTGTVLLAAPRGVDLDPRFGAGSAAAHELSGATRLAGGWPTLRQDVDTPQDLAAATRLGLGPSTAALLAGQSRYGVRMQGTVATYDPQSRSGTLLLDDGTEVKFGTAAFDASGLRLLRLGQRLRVEYDGAGAVTRVSVPTLS